MSDGKARLDALPGRDLPGGLRLSEAETRKARMDGLAGLDELPDNYGLHFPRCRSIQTMTMRFPLDLVWLDGEGRVVRIDENVPRGRMKSCLGARSVVETNAGQGAVFAAALGKVEAGWVP